MHLKKHTLKKLRFVVFLPILTTTMAALHEDFLEKYITLRYQLLVMFEFDAWMCSSESVTNGVPPGMITVLYLNVTTTLSSVAIFKLHRVRDLNILSSSNVAPVFVVNFFLQAYRYSLLPKLGILKSLFSFMRRFLPLKRDALQVLETFGLCQTDVYDRKWAVYAQACYA